MMITALMARREPEPIPPTPQRRTVTLACFAHMTAYAPALRIWHSSKSQGSPRTSTHGHATPSVSYAHITPRIVP
jgi:hypothetical protein